jgi:hypothetical protein
VRRERPRIINQAAMAARVTATLWSMSEADRREVAQTVTLDHDERVWLEARLAEYRDLLVYLREH